MAFCFNKDRAKFDEFLQFVEEKKNDKGAVMPVLQEAQRLFGYIPEEIVDFMALKLSKPSSEIYGVASFYSQFTFKPRGKHSICICLGTACYVKGADKLLDDFLKELNVAKGEATADGLFSIVETRCVGECALAPVVTVGEDVYDHVKESQVTEIINKYKE